VEDWFGELARLPGRAVVTNEHGAAVDLGVFFEIAAARFRAAGAQGGKLMFVGNGGSASIASHMAIDFSKNAGLPAMAFNDGVTLTCLGNDLGYDQVFARQIEMYGKAEDVLLAISSSGNSANILNAVAAARRLHLPVLTFSGFQAENKLRRLGDWNLYVPSSEYGFVEIVHLAVVHAVLDLAMGWTAEKGLWAQRSAA
jgi:D-sedoheptulose 7-phosphate isomerase